MARIREGLSVVFALVFDPDVWFAGSLPLACVVELFVKGRRSLSVVGIFLSSEAIKPILLGM